MAARAPTSPKPARTVPAIVAAVTGDDEDNLVVCQMAKHHFAVPRTIARVNNPRNEELFRHLGVDEIISPTRMALAAIEQDIPVHELLHLAQLEGGELELIEAQIAEDSPAIGPPPDGHRPAGGLLHVRAHPRRPRSAMRPETIFQAGDKVIAISRTECETDLHRQLIGAAPLEGVSTAARPGREKRTRARVRTAGRRHPYDSRMTA